MINLGPAWIWAILLVVGVLGLVTRNKIADMLGGVGSVVGLNKRTTLMVFVVLAIVAGGFGVITGLVNGASVASITGGSQNTEIVQGAVIGGLSLKVHDGLSNVTATEDTIDDTDKFMSIYSADANIADGEEYIFNVTVDREFISEDGQVKVSCSIPDKEIDGIIAKNLAEKTAGKIDLDINDGGTHLNDNTVWKYIAFSEGTGSAEVQVAFDQEETYHDGMTDLQEYVDVTCEFAPVDGSSSDSVVVRIYADN